MGNSLNTDNDKVKDLTSDQNGGKKEKVKRTLSNSNMGCTKEATIKSKGEYLKNKGSNRPASCPAAVVPYNNPVDTANNKRNYVSNTERQMHSNDNINDIVQEDVHMKAESCDSTTRENDPSFYVRDNWMRSKEEISEKKKKKKKNKILKKKSKDKRSYQQIIKSMNERLQSLEDRCNSKIAVNKSEETSDAIAYDEFVNDKENVLREFSDTCARIEKFIQDLKMKKMTLQRDYNNSLVRMEDQWVLPGASNTSPHSVAGKEDEARSLQHIIFAMNEKLLSLEHDCNNTVTADPLSKIKEEDDDDDETTLKHFSKTCARIRNCVQELKMRNISLQKENNKHLNRLSEVAGAMLSHNNANIANLNDSHRPMKISERYGNLYDNEWSDAYSDLRRQNFDERTTIHHLFSLLKVIYLCCQRKAELQEGHMFTMADNSKEQITEMWKAVPEQREIFMETRKRMAPVVIQFLQSSLNADDLYKAVLQQCTPALQDDILNVLYSTPSRQYFDKCVEVCWYMAIQIPPLFLDTSPLEGTTLNKDTHKEYTISGTIVDFIVWPTLYLTEEGKSILFKGTAQPLKNESAV